MNPLEPKGVHPLHIKTDIKMEVYKDNELDKEVREKIKKVKEEVENLKVRQKAIKRLTEDKEMYVAMDASKTGSIQMHVILDDIEEHWKKKLEDVEKIEGRLEKNRSDEEEEEPETEVLDRCIKWIEKMGNLLKSIENKVKTENVVKLDKIIEKGELKEEFENETKADGRKKVKLTAKEKKKLKEKRRKERKRMAEIDLEGDMYSK